MRKALLAGVLTVMMMSNAALAGTYEGSVSAASSVSVEAASDGVLNELNVQVGEIVAEGDVVGSVRATRVFASQDGVVARIEANEGDEIDGTVLEINPVEKYNIYCTVDKAYQSAVATLVHAGERVYIKCTSNGTHCGVGIITQIDGAEFRVLAIGGELYVGETVYLYRDADFSSKLRVGIGTVVGSDTEVYKANGKIIRLHVAEGECVERGELLYEISEGDGIITASETGIVAEVNVSKGGRVTKDQTIAAIVPFDQLCIVFRTDENGIAQIHAGDEAAIIYTADPQEQVHVGIVAEISYIAEEDVYAVKVIPENVEGLKLGMTATVWTKES